MTVMYLTILYIPGGGGGGGRQGVQPPKYQFNPTKNVQFSKNILTPLVFSTINSLLYSTSVSICQSTLITLSASCDSHLCGRNLTLQLSEPKRPAQIKLYFAYMLEVGP